LPVSFTGWIQSLKKKGSIFKKIAMDNHNCINKIRSAVQNGSHPQPPDENIFQPTSVMALFILKKEIELLFIQKADVKGYPWANQMAFPGGHMDRSDRSTRETALRELNKKTLKSWVLWGTFRPSTTRILRPGPGYGIKKMRSSAIPLKFPGCFKSR
jgi:hypothetical protein